MTLARAWLLHFLWLVPLTALVLVAHSRQKKKALERFADADFLLRLVGRDQRGRRFFKGLLLLSSLGLMLFALAGPRWGSHYQEVSQKGVDVMMVVDVSPSMMVEDIQPSRLERARREIYDFLQVVQGDRVGTVAFSGAAFVQCPLTLDYAALQMFLDALEPELLPVPGTDLGAAIETGISSFDLEAETDKVIILITDGGDNEGRGLELAEKAAQKGIRIFVFGMGEETGGPVPVGDGKGGFKKDKGGKLVLSKLEEESLRKIAAITGGTSVRSVAGDLDLDVLYFEGIRSRTEAQTLKSGKIKVYEERFSIFVLAALLLLLVEGMVGERAKLGQIGGKEARRKRRSPISDLRLQVVGFLVLSLVCARHGSAADDPDELYRRGLFTEAEQAYARWDMDHPQDIRYRYNRGCAAYQNSEYQGAMAAFSSVLRRAKDDETRFRASYNLGNTAYKQGDLESASAYFRQALLHGPASEDARHNLELTLRELAKQADKSKADQEAQHQKDAQQPKGEQDPGDIDKESPESQKQGEQEEPSEQQGTQSQDDQGERESSEGEELEQDKGDRKDKGRSVGHETPEDLSGELKPLQALPEQRGDDQSGDPEISMIDKNKAEALLDNIKEERSRLLRFQIPQEKRHGVQSGKDW